MKNAPNVQQQKHRYKFAGIATSLIFIMILGFANWSNDARAQDMAAGEYHSLFLKNDGTVWACGSNGYGQLGDGTTTGRSTAVQVSGLTDITAIAAGGYHSLFLKNDGTVWASGLNSYGQLGDGTTTDGNTPVQVSGLTDITAIAAGTYHSLFLKTDGTVWACGLNSYGQLGDGTIANRSTAVQVSGLTGITAIAAGFLHSLFLKTDGTVWACGNNSYGQLGDGTTTNRSTAVQVSGLTDITAIAGSSHSLFLKSDATVWACGLNYNGELGDGTTTNRRTAVQVSGLTGITAIAAGYGHSLFLKNDGMVWACGDNSNGELGDGTTTNRSTAVQVSGLTDITTIAGGDSHSLFLKNDGMVWACGYNGNSQLGDGTTTNRSTAVHVTSLGNLSGFTATAGGVFHSVFLKNDGTVWACGRNVFGQLGNGTTTNRSTVGQVSGLTDITTIAGGDNHSLFLKNDGTVWVCGWNSYGQLGDGTTTARSTAVQVSGLTDITAIAAGFGHSLFLKNDGTVWACGLNSYGQLGDGTTTDRSTVVQVSGLTDIIAIAAGRDHSLFLKNDGTVWACGSNGYGQLGDGTTTARSTAVQVSGLTDITGIDAGYGHSLFLKNDGTVWACGLNSYGQLGDGTTTDRSTVVQVSGLTDIIAIAAGSVHSLFLKNDGTVWACGDNHDGQLGDGTTTGRLTPVQVSGLTGITAIAAGEFHSLFLKTDGTVWACGYNVYGQLGDGTTTGRSTAVATTGMNWLNLGAVPTLHISGATSVCAGAAITLSTDGAGGTWSTPNTTVATVDGTGIVTGIAAGQAVISYSVPGSTATFTVTVGQPVITAIDNDGPVCAGTTFNLSSSATGDAPLTYAWSGPNSFSATTQSPAVASAPVAAGGIYTLVITDANSCVNTGTTTATVHSLPVISSINASTPVCEFQPLSLYTNVTGGSPSYTYSWTGPQSYASGDQAPLVTASATVLQNGTYSLTVTDANNCAATGPNTTDVTVYAIQPIVGSTTVVFGQSITLSDPVTGGAWSTATPWTTGINASTGVVKGVSAGTSVITYTTGNGCTATYTVDVLSGVNACVGQTITISDGTTGGTWASNNGSIATVGLTTGVITGVGVGKAVITHRPAAGGIITTTVTVNPLAATTSSTSSVCQGQSLVLANGTAGGGTWYSGNTATAMVSASGVVTGIAGGTLTIYYTPTAGCATTKTITILPVAPITGTPVVCVGQTTALSNSMSGGAWSSSSGALATVAASGIVGGVGAGSPRISYIWPTGCYSTATVTVKALSTTTGGAVVCQNQSTTFANTTPGGGAWSSSNTAVAVVSSGVVTGIGSGSASILFTAANGCVATKPISVNPAAAITGGSAVCVGQTINVSNSIGGGNWSSSSGAVASVSAAGMVRGMAAGTARISYIILATGCHAIQTVTVNALSPTTGGTPAICASNSMTLANATPFGGVWSSSNSSAATVNPTTGFVKGTGAGVTTISFTTTVAGCVATRTVTVNACREAGEGVTPSLDEATATSFDIRLFPNPNNGTFTLNGTVAHTDEELTIDVLNMVGQVIYTSRMKPEHGIVNSSIALDHTLASGHYLLRLHSAGGGKVFHFVISQ